MAEATTMNAFVQYVHQVRPNPKLLKFAWAKCTHGMDVE
jgi:hypothetical protein